VICFPKDRVPTSFRKQIILIWPALSGLRLVPRLEQDAIGDNRNLRHFRMAIFVMPDRHPRHPRPKGGDPELSVSS
jgi:hypothetical protein